MTTPPPDLTIDEARRTIDRLTAENQGLHERIEKLEETNSALEEELEWWMDDAGEANSFWNEWGDGFIQDAQRILELEARIVMLTRSKGTGLGRGRPPDWSAGQAEQVRSLKEGGMSYRRIADETRLSLRQVQRILKPPTPRPVVTREDREDHLARLSLGGFLWTWILST